MPAYDSVNIVWKNIDNNNDNDNDNDNDNNNDDIYNLVNVVIIYIKHL